MSGLRRYWLTIAAMLAFFLILFGIVEALGVKLLTDPSAWLDRGEYPTNAVSSAPNAKDGTTRLKINSTAAKRRMQVLSDIGGG